MRHQSEIRQAHGRVKELKHAEMQMHARCLGMVMHAYVMSSAVEYSCLVCANTYILTSICRDHEHTPQHFQAELRLGICVQWKTPAVCGSGLDAGKVVIVQLAHDEETDTGQADRLPTLSVPRRRTGEAMRSWHPLWGRRAVSDRPSLRSLPPAYAVRSSS